MDAAFTLIEASLNLLDILYTTYCAHKENGPVLLSLRSRVDRIRRNIQLFCESSSSTDVQGSIERRIRDEFTVLNSELEEIRDKSNKFPLVVRLVTATRTADSMAIINDRLDSLEKHLDVFGLMKDLRNCFDAQAEAVKEELHFIFTRQPKIDPELRVFLQQIENGIAAIALQIRAGQAPTQPVASYSSSLGQGSTTGPPDVVPDESLDTHEEAEKQMMQSLPDKLAKMSMLVSKSPLSLDDKTGIMQKIDGLREGWKLRLEDIHYEEASIRGRSKPLKLGEGAFSTVYKAKLQLRGAGGRPEGSPVSVAAKELKLEWFELQKYKADILRELHLLKEYSHPSILHAYGAFWPAEDCSEEEFFPPVIVTERMTFHLRAALDDRVLQNTEKRRSVLIDIATALSHLHKQNIVHRDVKPENVLLRVVDGEVVGPAKLSDFGVSRKVHQTKLLTTYASTRGPSGTVMYMPPEVLQDTSRSVSRRSWDVWSFGLLICAVAGRKEACSLQVSAFDVKQFARSGELATAAQQWATSIADKDMRIAAMRCLCGDWKKRVKMDAVVSLLTPVDPEEAMRKGKVAYFQYVRKDDESSGRQALDYFLYAWNSAEVSAAPWVALCQQNGLGDSRQESSTTYREGHRKGNMTCTYKLGHVYMWTEASPSEKEKAYKLLLGASNAGSLAGTYLLARCLDEGFGVEKDKDAAAKMYSKFMRSVEACLESTEMDEITRGDLLWMAGRCYEGGDGVKRNESEAVKYYRRSVEVGSTDGLHELAICYSDGVGIKADEKEGAALTQKAADRGCMIATTYLGMTMLYGCGVKRSPVKAFHSFQKAADAGFGIAEFLLGKCYKHGVGIKKNMELASTYSSRARSKYLIMGEEVWEEAWEDLRLAQPSLRNWFRGLPV